MSLRACIPGLVARGEISAEQGERLRGIYDDLIRSYRNRMSDAAAEAMASEDAIAAMTRDAQRRHLNTLREIDARAEMLKRRPEDPTSKAAAAWAPDQVKRTELRHAAVVKTAYRTMDGILAKFRRDIAGRVRNRALLDQVVDEAFGRDTGSLSASELGRAWLATAEYLRGRFNAAGGAIGKLDKWGLPQWHDSDRIRALIKEHGGVDAAYRFWRDAELPRLDRNAMIDSDTGAPFSDEALERALRDVFETFRTDGWSKRTAGDNAGKGALANQRSKERFLIYKSPEDWRASHEQFGKGTAFDAMIGHVEGMARDIAALEILGPNPEASIRWLKDFAVKAGKTAQDDGKAGERGESAAGKVQSLWNEYTGANQRPGSRVLADIGSAVRSYETASKLGSAVLSAVPGDLSTQYMTAKFNGLPFTKILVNYLKLLNPLDEGHRRLAIRLSAGAEGWAHLQSTSMRALNSAMTRQWAARLAEGVLRATGMGRWTDAGRWAHQITLLGEIADHADLTFDKINPRLRATLERGGIGADAWERIRSTPQRKEGGASWIFPEDIADQGLADRIIELGAKETDLAVPVADLETRAMLHEQARAGTVMGELIKDSLLFKSFGIAMLLVHGKRVMEMASWRDRGSYMLRSLIAMTMAGAMTIQLKEIAKGKDPRPMDDWKFWEAAILQGGGFGIVGDLLQLTTDPRMSSFAKYIAGPVADTLDSAKKLGQAGFERAFDIRSKDGTKANPGGAFVAMLQRELPGSNLFYTRLAFQRLVLDQLSKAIDPRWSQSRHRMERAARDQRQAFFWRPGETAPERAPNLANMAGQSEGVNLQ